MVAGNLALRNVDMSYKYLLLWALIALAKYSLGVITFGIVLSR